jgi:hypothetical protein
MQSGNVVFIITAAALFFCDYAAARQDFSTTAQFNHIEAAARIQTVTGKVISCSPDEFFITVDAETGQPVIIYAVKATAIYKGSRNIRLAQIKINDTVMATYEINKGKNIANVIFVYW